MVIRKGCCPVAEVTPQAMIMNRGQCEYFGRQQNVENVNFFDVRNIHENDAAEYRPDDVLAKIAQLH